MKTVLCKHRKIIALVASLFLILQPTIAAATPLTFKEKMNLTAMMESSGTAIEALNFLGYIPNGQNLDLSGDFSASGFSSNTSGLVNGEAFSLAYSGSLSGDLGSNILISLASNGTLGTETISSAGQMTWFFDPISDDYLTFEYAENGEINPFWIPFLIGVGAGIVGNLVYDYIVDGQIGSPSKSAPKVINQTINNNGTNNTCNKTIKDPLFLSCTWDDNRHVVGSITVPEPTTSLLMLAGFLSLAFLRRRHM